MLGLGLGLVAGRRPPAGPPPNTTPMTLYLNSAANSALPAFRNLGTAQVNAPVDGGGGVAGGTLEELLGGGTAQFVTGRVPAGGGGMQAGGAVSFSINGNDPNNTGATPHYRFRGKLLKRTSAGVESLIGTWDDDATLLNTGPAYTWSGTVASAVSLAEDDRLIFRLFVVNPGGGNLAGGWVSFGTGDPNWLSTLVVPTTIAFKAEA